MDCFKFVGLLSVGCIIVIQLCMVAAAPIDTTNDVCKATSHERWSSKKGRCVKCKDCPAKKGRNVTDSSIQIRTGEHGALNCFPCKYCPTYHFAKANQCHKCNLNKCQELHRKVLKECSFEGDVECSPICENGYHSDTGINDRYHHCVANSVSTTTLPVTTTTPLLVIVSSVSSATRIGSNVTKTNESSSVSSDYSLEEIKRPEIDLNELPLGAILLIASLSVIVLLGIAFIGFTMYRKKSKEISPASSAMTSDESVPLNFSQIIEMDCGNSTDSITKTNNDIKNEQDVRAELSRDDESPPEPHPELTQVLLTQGPICCRFNHVHQKDKCMYKKEICKCKPLDNCLQCEQVSIDIKVEDEHLLIVKTNVCHHPEGVFKRLGIPESIVYSYDDDRERNPEKTTQSEYIYKVLKYWTRTKCEKAKLNDLIKALCKERFHDISSKLLEHFRKKQAHSQSVSQNIVKSHANSSLSDEASMYLNSEIR